MKAILFDMDGTIINSEEGITKCVQYALRSFGVEEPDLSRLLCFIGPPLDPVFREKYGMTWEQSWEAVEKYRERYDVKGIYECKIYDGVKETIELLKEKGYILAVASSKPESACKRIVEHFGLAGAFDFVAGSTLDGSVSTKQEVLELLIERMQEAVSEKKITGEKAPQEEIPREEMCLIGDTKYDALGAFAVNIRCIGVSYGFGTREELLLAGAAVVYDDIREVVNYIESN